VSTAITLACGQVTTKDQQCQIMGTLGLTGFLAASFGLEPGVRPSCLSPGAARRSEWSGLAVDVLLDDGRGCGCAGDGEIGRRSQVAAYAGADTRAGEFAPYRVGGAALEAMGESG